MKNKITQYIETLYTEKHAKSAHCDLTSSNIKMVNVPIPTDLFNELEVISSEYGRDINCMAGDLLTFALEEAIEHIPMEEKKYLEDVKRNHEREIVDIHKRQAEFNVGGT